MKRQLVSTLLQRSKYLPWHAWDVLQGVARVEVGALAQLAVRVLESRASPGEDLGEDLALAGPSPSATPRRYHVLTRRREKTRL